MALTNSHIIRNEDDFQLFLALLRESSVVSLDVEASPRSSDISNVAGIGFCFHPEVAYYVPLQHSEPMSGALMPYTSDESVSLDFDNVVAELKPLLETDARTYVLHNAKVGIRS